MRCGTGDWGRELFLLLGLHIELGDCRSYNYDMIFLRDLFGMRQELSNELYCYKNRGSERYHWSRVPELYYNYVIPRRSPSNLLQMTELHEQCFNQFTKSKLKLLWSEENFFSLFPQVTTQSILTVISKNSILIFVHLNRLPSRWWPCFPTQRWRTYRARQQWRRPYWPTIDRHRTHRP